MNKDHIEREGENVARAILQINNRIIKQIHTFDSLIFDPWISEGGKARAKRNKECGFVQMIKELAEISTDMRVNTKTRSLKNNLKNSIKGKRI